MSERWTVVEATTIPWPMRDDRRLRELSGDWLPRVGIAPYGDHERRGDFACVLEHRHMHFGNYRVRILIERDDSYEPEGDKR